MAAPSGLSRHKRFSEFSDVVDEGSGAVSPAKQRQQAAGNLQMRGGYDGNAPASIATAGNVTLTAAQMATGIIVRDPAGAARTDTLPTAALLVAGLPGVKVGQIVSVLIVNGADAAETITLAAGTGGAFDTNQTAASRVIPQNASKLVHVRFTNVTAGAEAYVVYA